MSTFGLVAASLYGPLNLASFPLLFFVFVFMPAGGIYSYLYIKSGKPLRPKLRRYVTAITLQFVGLAVAVVAARREHIVVFPARYPNLVASIAGFLYMLLVLYRISASLPKAKSERITRMRRSLPENGEQLKYWVVASFSAGIAEEIVYRGVAYSLILSLTESVVLAVAICSVAFGVAHAMQGWPAVLSVSLFGAMFHIAAIGTGSLYLGMLLHVGYDIGLGLIARRFFQKVAVRNSLSVTA